MLGQLVCIDRRYQRMNCFNIREIQALLKRRFFADLVNQHDYRIILDTTTIGLKYKMNDIHFINTNTLNFYKTGIETSKKTKIYKFIKNIFNTNEKFMDKNTRLFTSLKQEQKYTNIIMN